jgi:glutamyl-tRNA reductase
MKAPQGVVTSARVSHDEATLSQIERAGVEDVEATLESLLARPTVVEAVLIQTCHRVEAYVVTADPDAGERAIDAVVDPGPAARYAGHEESLRHLLRIGAGLESIVVGEDQVLGQLREAAQVAKTVDALGSLLEPIVMKAIHVGERARSETAINEGAISLGSAAVRFARQQVRLDGATAVVVGAGEMAQLAAKALAEHVDELTVLNRTPERAVDLTGALAGPVDTTAAGLDVLPQPLDGADVVVTATGAERPVLTDVDLDAAGELVVMDLGQPRDVTTGPHPEPVEVYDLDAIETVSDRAHERRQAAATEVAEMVDTELTNLQEQLKRARADDAIAAMYESAEVTKRREVQTALDKMAAQGDVSPAQEEVVEDLADALVNQLLAAPTRSLRDAAAEDDWETIDTALRLFDPDFGDESPLPAVDGEGADSRPTRTEDG